MSPPMIFYSCDYPELGFSVIISALTVLQGYNQAKLQTMNMSLPLIRKITRCPKRSSDLHRLLKSALFDANWYLANNPDVAKTEMDPLLHYYSHGGFEGRDLGPEFSSSWYLDSYEDVKKAGINQLVHYIKFGRKEGRKIQKVQLFSAIGKIRRRVLRG
jgi:hypothetical protein